MVSPKVLAGRLTSWDLLSRERRKMLSTVLHIFVEHLGLEGKGV